MVPGWFWMRRYRVDECDAGQDRRAAGDQPVQPFDGGPVDELGVVEKQSAVDGEFQDGVAVAGPIVRLLPVSAGPARAEAMWSDEIAEGGRQVVGGDRRQASRR